HGQEKTPPEYPHRKGAVLQRAPPRRWARERGERCPGRRDERESSEMLPVSNDLVHELEPERLVDTLRRLVINPGIRSHLRTALFPRPFFGRPEKTRPVASSPA